MLCNFSLQVRKGKTSLHAIDIIQRDGYMRIQYLTKWFVTDWFKQINKYSCKSIITIMTMYDTHSQTPLNNITYFVKKNKKDTKHERKRMSSNKWYKWKNKSRSCPIVINHKCSQIILQSLKKWFPTLPLQDSWNEITFANCEYLLLVACNILPFFLHIVTDRNKVQKK